MLFLIRDHQRATARRSRLRGPKNAQAHKDHYRGKYHSTSKHKTPRFKIPQRLLFLFLLAIIFLALPRIRTFFPRPKPLRAALAGFPPLAIVSCVFFGSFAKTIS